MIVVLQKFACIICVGLNHPWPTLENLPYLVPPWHLTATFGMLMVWTMLVSFDFQRSRTRMLWNMKSGLRCRIRYNIFSLPLSSIDTDSTKKGRYFPPEEKGWPIDQTTLFSVFISVFGLYLSLFFSHTGTFVKRPFFLKPLLHSLLEAGLLCRSV